MSSVPRNYAADNPCAKNIGNGGNFVARPALHDTFVMHRPVFVEILDDANSDMAPCCNKARFVASQQSRVDAAKLHNNSLMTLKSLRTLATLKESGKRQFAAQLSHFPYALGFGFSIRRRCPIRIVVDFRLFQRIRSLTETRLRLAISPRLSPAFTLYI